MTGFGAASGPVGPATATVEVRSVNHRYFNPSVKLPMALSRWEADARDALKRRIVRGHVTLTARLEGVGGESAGIDEAKVIAYIGQLDNLRKRLGMETQVSLDAVLRLPNVISGGEAPDLGEDAAGFVAVVNQAVQALDEMRIAEGARLTGFISTRMDLIEASCGRIESRAPTRLVEHRDRLRRAVRELAEGVIVDEQRLAQEIAILADRLDVTEELQRFRTHIGATRSTLTDPPIDGVGKRLGFLLQELLREANTTGSKAGDAEVVREIITIKEELERIREQVENLE